MDPWERINPPPPKGQVTWREVFLIIVECSVLATIIVGTGWVVIRYLVHALI